MNPDARIDGDLDETTPIEGMPLDGEQVLDFLTREILHQVEVRPYAALAVAAGVGYVLGAGLPNWASRLVLNVGSRMAFARVASVFGEP